MSNEFFLEIGTEEIPAGYIVPALDHLKKQIAEKLRGLALPFEEIKTAATPRRLALAVTGLANCQPDRREEVMGPPKKAAFDADNNPTKAATGFAASRGATIDDIQIAETPKGEYLMLVVEKKGKNTIDLLADMIPDMIRNTPFPKSMRWSDQPRSFARPIQWLVALFGDKIIPFSYNNCTTGNLSRGHRFMAEGEVEIKGYDHYLRTMLQQSVVAEIPERRQQVEDEVTEAAASVNGKIIPDPDLLDTVTNLVEIPDGVCGSFDEKFLELPQEVLITSMRVHQKYFTITDDNGIILPNFVAVNNTAIEDRELAVAGHERVLRARLEDALFFFKEDQQHTLDQRRQNLAGVVFQAKLGTMLAKCDRIEKLAAQLTAQLAADDKDIVQRAAHLAKADLVTDMVGEFPSLQGVMGKYYAQLQGEEPAVAEAIAEHYLPLRAGSKVPESTAGAIISMADRLDTICGCFAIGKTPTGTTDPYGLRRHALALIHIIEEHGFRLSLTSFIEQSMDLYGDLAGKNKEKTSQAILEFIKGRFVNDLTSRAVSSEAVDAVTSITFDDIVDCRMRIDALIKISSQETFTLLAGAFKRVINIIKDHDQTAVDETLLVEAAEKALYRSFQKISDRVKPLVADQNYDEALTAILEMKEDVDKFFDDVMVMAEDEDLKNNRLALLTGIARLFLQVGDFSRMNA